ncbi:Hypothetical_protein [Hexamita inflata]|uniref:Hypothetical_protein n=1 Tax=Hexamita inflata TaxID=28002 RepID=A0AA86URU6_9EUKA|nr:Hypothetical protein HINF_LOCUS56850 [Hexamita inflata]CAI9969216.1 Hypothetical protein HINF_LOCUS56861 [Hexamita inflata]
MECFKGQWDCVTARGGNQECKYYEDLYMYCYFSVKNVAWWVWLVLAAGILLLVSFVACCVCCCRKKRAKYQRIVEVKCLSEEQEHMLPVQNTQAYKPYQLVHNAQPVMPHMFVQQPIYQQMPTGVSNCGYQYGGQQLNVTYQRDPLLHIMK